MSFDNIFSPTRLEALAKSGLMDSDPELEFDRVTRLVSRVLGVDASLVSLVDDKRQFFKSAFGLPPDYPRSTPLSRSVCKHVVCKQDAVKYADAERDAALAGVPEALEVGATAYLGVPVRNSEGHVLGALCAVHRSPRPWTESDQRAMEDFAAIVEEAIWLRDTARGAISLARRSELLASEYNHRAKNMLSIAQALVRLSSRDATNVPEMTDDLTGRLQALSNAHTTLETPGGIEIETLLERLLAPYRNQKEPYVLAGPGLRLDRSQLTPICLIVHELATNSAKYGAIQRESAPRVDWRLDGGDVEIVWSEAGDRAGETPARSGFGNTLLRASTRQLGGEISSARTGGRFVVTLRFPGALVERA